MTISYLKGGPHTLFILISNDNLFLIRIHVRYPLTYVLLSIIDHESLIFLMFFFGSIRTLTGYASQFAIHVRDGPAHGRTYQIIKCLYDELPFLLFFQCFVEIFRLLFCYVLRGVYV